MNITIENLTKHFGEKEALNIQRYDIHGKRILENLQKVYFGDVGLRNHIVGGERERDIEKVIETVVYQHLVRLGYSVTVGELRVGEIDFVCQKSNQIRYVQSAYLIDNEDTRMREFGRLSQIRNHYPKYVVSLTPMVKASDYDGVNSWEYDNINGFENVTETTEKNSFYASHKIGNEGFVDYSTLNLPEAYYSGQSAIYPTDDHGSLSGGKVLTSTSNDDLAIAELSTLIYLEGWNHSIIDKNIGYYYNLGLTFQINRVE